jgi:hypothetical protein
MAPNTSTMASMVRRRGRGCGAWRSEGAFDRVAEALRFDFLVGEGLHGGHGVEDFAGHGRGVGHAVLRIARQLAHAAKHDDGQTTGSAGR